MAIQWNLGPIRRSLKNSRTHRINIPIVVEDPTHLNLHGEPRENYAKKNSFDAPRNIEDVASGERSGRHSTLRYQQGRWWSCQWHQRQPLQLLLHLAAIMLWRNHLCKDLKEEEIEARCEERNFWDSLLCSKGAPGRSTAVEEKTIGLRLAKRTLGGNENSRRTLCSSNMVAD